MPASCLLICLTCSKYGLGNITRGLGKSVNMSFLHTTVPGGLPNTEQFRVAVLPTSKRSSGGVIATRCGSEKDVNMGFINF
ncbi:hypothetical protein CDAR_245901 [Caerostris darwini]|uniref:Uncharacterized protein n=1 Tax=Caerostris darwini TaxID=1538125 RepID=A0AAV4VI14_9ARAC|nr:hypothetical protein CDAR_245901 [Caerostris darwini]